MVPGDSAVVMIDFEEARIKMVDCQVRTCDVTEHGLISALMQVPREEFVPEDARPLAYIDEDISLAKLGAGGRFIMEPGPFAKLLQLADVQEDDFVLVIGCGSGYSAAVLSLLGASVIAIEEDKALAQYANAKMTELGFDNVVVRDAKLAGGYHKEAPYDVIFVDGSVEELPDALPEQLAENGRLVVVKGQGNSATAQIITKNDGILSSRKAMNLAVKPLPGFEKAAEFQF